MERSESYSRLYRLMKYALGLYPDTRYVIIRAGDGMVLYGGNRDAGNESELILDASAVESMIAHGHDDHAPNHLDER
jgi:hypothetical protein